MVFGVGFFIKQFFGVKIDTQENIKAFLYRKKDAKLGQEIVY